jgi:hypothetical protein
MAYKVDCTHCQSTQTTELVLDDQGQTIRMVLCGSCRCREWVVNGRVVPLKDALRTIQAVATSRR